MNHYCRKNIHRQRDRGSALLIVFVLAAVIAIMLYREMPIAAFEARRQKEQTLIDRGHEYQRGVQLYYRKFQGRYPANIQMLESTNNLRFLRRRYVDPFTGKDDWRLLHAGPGGQLMDSKVRNFNQNGIFGQNGINANGSNQLGTGLGGSPNGFGSNNSNANTGTGNSSSTSPHAFEDSSSSSSSDSDVTVAPVAKRAPVVAANGQGGGTPSSSELNQDPSTPLLPSQGDLTSASSTDAAAVANPPGTAPANDNTTANQQGKPLGTGANQSQGQSGPGAFGTTPAGGLNGNSLGGAFAGVASKAKGHAIKKINDQTNYSLWEFWYDPTKDTSMGNLGSLQNGAGGVNLQNGAPGMSPNNSNTNNNSAFGANGSNTFTPPTPPGGATSTPATPDNGSNTLPTSQPAQPQ